MQVSTSDLVRMFMDLSETMEREKEALCVLDGAIGDADHGIAMALGFRAITLALDPSAVSDPSNVFAIAAKSFLNAVGASSGPLYGTAFLRAAAVAKGKAQLEDADVVAILEAMARGIQDRGKAALGEKTMLDAWLPAAAAARAAFDAGADINAVFAAAVAAAKEGVEATKDMLASKGRAARLGERARGHIDPGAASAVLVLETMRRGLARGEAARD